jgi:hypothetical protein
MRRERRIDGLSGRHGLPDACFPDFGIRRVDAVFLAVDQVLLTVVLKLSILMAFVERDHIRERPDREVLRRLREVLVELDLQLGSAAAARGSRAAGSTAAAFGLKRCDAQALGHVEEFRAVLLHDLHARFDQRVAAGMAAEVFARDDNARTLQAVGDEELRVVDVEMAGAVGGDRILRVHTDHAAEHDRGVTDGSRHRSSGVAAQAQRNNPRAAQ